MSEQQAAAPFGPQRLMQIAWGFAPALIVGTAAETGVFNALADGSRSLDTLAATTGASRRGLRAILNALAGVQLVEKIAPDSYRLTPESAAFLVESSPAYIGDLFRHFSSQLIPGWLRLTESVRSGAPVTAVDDERTGAPFFAAFVESLYLVNRHAAAALAAHLGADRPGGLSVLDLAAGSGVWSLAFAQASPQVRVTAVDWPMVLEVTRRVAARLGLADRYRMVAGDLLQAPFGEGHHVATLGHILHSEGEARSRRLLNKTFDALAPGGTVAIAEFLVEPDRSGPPVALIFAVNMLVHTHEGDTYSCPEIAGWLEEAGFVNTRTLEIPGPSPLILADRPR